MTDDRVLYIRDLFKVYGAGCPSCLERTGASRGRNQCPDCHSIVAVHGISLDLYPGEILGVIGGSGSGKSSLVRMLYFDETPSAGRAHYFDGQKHWDLFSLNPAQQHRLRNEHLGMVYQNPHLGLNFGYSAGGNVAERLLMNHVDSYGAIRKRARQLLERTGVPVRRMDESPAAFSGGMQQRVQIAKALATHPHLVLLDEITTGLDVSVQARILDLILEIQEESKTTMMVVAHDLGVIRLLASRTLVMHSGQIVESGITDQILEDPQHPYTQELVGAAL